MSSHRNQRRQTNRRSFLAASTGGLAAAGAFDFLGRLPRVSAQDLKQKPNLVRLDDSIEPLVRVIEDTPRGQLLERVAERIHDGTSYREVLAALLLAGVRNVQPRPSVGFKFHCVLVVNSCHLASLSGPDEDRWLPIFWALDYFKSSQADEARRSGWQMAPVKEGQVPKASQARAMFIEAMDAWDAEKADAATAGLVRTAGATEVFNLFATYAARDYRSIGHKAIYLANAWRTLQVIGWEMAEPVMRSLAFALLNHSGEPNPANSDLAADRPWRENRKQLERIPATWLGGETDDALPKSLFEVFREGSPTAAAALAADSLSRGINPQSIWDGVFVGAGELLMRQPGIIGLHGLTTANAMHYLWSRTSDEQLRQRLLLQACSFNPMFRESAAGRGRLRDQKIDALESIAPSGGDADKGNGDGAIDEILTDISKNPMTAAAKVQAFLSEGGSGQKFIDAARRLLFLKGRDAHDYKFASAVLEDYSHISQPWQAPFMATSVFHLKGSTDRNSDLLDRTRAAVGG